MPASFVGRPVRTKRFPHLIALVLGRDLAGARPEAGPQRLGQFYERIQWRDCTWRSGVEQESDARLVRTGDRGVYEVGPIACDPWRANLTVPPS